MSEGRHSLKVSEKERKVNGLLGPSAVAPLADEAALSRAISFEGPSARVLKKIGKAFLWVSGISLVVVIAVMISSLSPASTKERR